MECRLVALIDQQPSMDSTAVIWAENQQLAAVAVNLVRRQPKVIVASATTAAILKEKTS
jgi:hypothetical protein